ncbi:RNA polymerase sigma factor [Candidatus Uabimicrobium amorphum]|uniref:RNA polymerase sigma factor n=1 Tax=Uabimicrobium amorphum TaxID=2596890 RepID=A0A5S9IP89_UABAM|nr:RNA polymerase sigma factor [Candidatus Uabimicrobium amorphum]BBM84941.1 RNA polymerase sigma-H factor [Candidatus Uabimicrobium amorphum]
MDWEKCSDERLVAYYLSGNKVAFSLIVSRYQKSLYGYLYRFVYDRHIAEDLVQETFVKVLVSLPRFNDQRRFRPWLFKIATNLALNKVRRRKKYRYDLNACEVSDVKTPLGNLLEKEKMEHVEQAICKLSAKHRVVFLLRVQQQFSYKEISLVVKCNEQTARSRMFYAVEKLREFLEEKS